MAYFGSAYSIELYSFGNNTSSTATTCLPYEHNSPDPVDEYPSLPIHIRGNKQERNQEHLAVLRKCRRYCEAITESFRLSRACVLPRVRCSQIVRASVPLRTAIRPSFRPAVLKRQALPRMES